MIMPGADEVYLVLVNVSLDCDSVAIMVSETIVATVQAVIPPVMLICSFKAQDLIMNVLGEEWRNVVIQTLPVPFEYTSRRGR